MNDEQLLRYSRHILLPRDRHRGPGEAARRARARDRRGRPGLPGRALPRFGRRRAASRSATATTSISPICSGRSCIARKPIGQPKVESARATLAVDQSADRGRRARRARRRGAPRGARRPTPTWSSTAATTSPRGTRSTARASRIASRWSRARRCASTARSRCSTCARPTSPCYACLFPGGRRERGRALRGDGRVRAADRHHRHDPGGGSAQAPDGRRRDARRPAAAARCAHDAAAHDQAREGPGLRGLRCKPDADSVGRARTPLRTAV